LAWALKAAAFAFCFLKAKTAFFSSPKAVKSCKNPDFWPIYCIFNLLKIYSFFVCFLKAKDQLLVPRPNFIRMQLE
jgi:hypothetical protein